MKVSSLFNDYAVIKFASIMWKVSIRREHCVQINYITVTLVVLGSNSKSNSLSGLFKNYLCRK